MLGEKNIGLRNTNQRQLIYKYLERTLTHPTADQVFQAIRKELPRISFGTVYRNLDILEKQGLISAVVYSKEHVRYHVGPMDHCHFVCLACDKLMNVEVEDLSELKNQVARRHGLAVHRYAMIFYGLCEQCQKLYK